MKKIGEETFHILFHVQLAFAALPWKIYGSVARYTIISN
jgi:hypothetical protein